MHSTLTSFDLKSGAVLLASAPAEIRENFLDKIGKGGLRALPFLFDFWALEHQLPPEGDWRAWVIMGGRGAGSLLPMVRTGGAVRINFRAGFASTWGALPADLGQAVLLLAAHYYEYRNETALSDGCMPFGVSSLLQRYRVMRIGIGSVQ